MSTRFNLDPASLLALAATRSSEVFHILNGVYITAEGLGVASNGRRLLWCRNAASELQEMPETGLILDMSPSFLKLAKEARRKALPLVVWNRDGERYVAMTGYGEPVVLPPMIEGPYPDHTRVYPKDLTRTTAPVAFAAEMHGWLEVVGNMADPGKSPGHGATRLRLTGTGRAAVVTFLREDWLGLAMPVQAEGFTPAPDDIHRWLAGQPQDADDTSAKQETAV